ncbi:TrkA family potassium uptake protein [uncultured Tyzzerella sp.]|uniref:potassium channel family protein n=1 Tax=uncultured Tyzzerella sp. TaxID=2321398 RepID=UPI00294390A6|nr:TrkA family potassium uptake protein [uncultured Tyzzerella sp.]
MGRNRQFAVLGLGRFGQSLARTLIENDCDVLCCDKDIEIVNEMAKYGCHSVQADVTDVHVLDQFGVNNFDVVIVAIGEDMEGSILATMMAKELGAKFVIAKAKNDIQKSILQKVGADRVVLPERDMGARIANTLITTNIIDYINLSDKFAIVEIQPEKNWVNKSILDSNVRAKHGLNIVAIKRENTVIVSPLPTEVIKQEDILVVVGENDSIQKINN